MQRSSSSVLAVLCLLSALHSSPALSGEIASLTLAITDAVPEGLVEANRVMAHVRTQGNVTVEGLDPASSPQTVIEAALAQGANFIVVPWANLTSTCAALARLNSPCKPMVELDKPALVARADTVTDLAELFEDRRLLRGTAIIWPPTDLLGSFLKWSGVPENQVPDVLSTERGFFYAFNNLFIPGQPQIWCPSVEAAVVALNTGKVDVVIGASHQVANILNRAQARTGLHTVANQTLAFKPSRGAWIALQEKLPRSDIKAVIDTSYQTAPKWQSDRADTIWRAALERAFDKQTDLHPFDLGNQITCAHNGPMKPSRLRLLPNMRP
jgi:hypothetical protein